MHCTQALIPLAETGYFSRIAIDYVNQSPTLRPFYEHPFSLEGIKASIEKRRKFNTDRKPLVEALEAQYAQVAPAEKVDTNIKKLAEENTFTITTAHQPNIFTGYLYFFYKILHTVRLADKLNKTFPDSHFVPVYYMGSEDADLEELGKIFLNGEYLTWDTKQTGAVGRMNTRGLDKLIGRIEGELSVLPSGAELINLLRTCYLQSPDIQTATFKLIHALFAEFGVVVLIPDSAILKRKMIPLFEDDLFYQTASSKVESTIQQLSAHYKVQAKPREINLFYLKDDSRERIVKNAEGWKVMNTDIRFTESALRKELNDHPERFSPNVILRGIFQETILPNLVFIGGGGELAYWLELKEMFVHYNVPFPALALRNSFLFIEQKWKEKMVKLGWNEKDLFRSERALADELVKKESAVKLSLANEINQANTLYDNIKAASRDVDVTLEKHAEALRLRSIKQLVSLEKKMLRAEKKKFEVQLSQVHRLKEKLFPGNNLQERVENFMPFFAKYGSAFIHMLYTCSPETGKDFIVLTEENKQPADT